MQRKYLLVCVLSVGAALSLPTLRALAQEGSLNYVVLSDRYYDGLYTDGPRNGTARYVYFVGESIPIALEIGNAAMDVQTIETAMTPLDQAFEVLQVRGPSNGKGRLTLSPEGVVISETGEEPLSWGNRITLSSHSRVVIRGEFSGPATPGLYEWKIVPKVASSVPVHLQGPSLHYELRQPQELSDRAEVARRRMIAAYDDEDDVRFEAAARELLRIYPNSALAFELRGRVSERLGRLDEARASYERAIGLIREGRDELYLKHNPTNRTQSTVDDLSQELGRTRPSR